MTTIAQVLHRAADHWLTVDFDDYENRTDSEKFSCCAIDAAAAEVLPYLGAEALTFKILHGLREMGLETSSGTAFFELGYPKGAHPETQAARYTWLKFAALIAEEQGV